MRYRYIIERFNEILCASIASVFDFACVLSLIIRLMSVDMSLGISLHYRACPHVLRLLYHTGEKKRRNRLQTGFNLELQFYMMLR